jgi:UDP-N-acetylmuramoylalanine--D-glutamate ligase
MNYDGMRVTVMGLGRFGGGVGVTRFLAGRGARVLVTDLEPAEKLADSVAALRDLLEDGKVTLRLGGHVEEDFAQVDLVVANPAVKPGHPLLQSALRRGVSVTTEIGLLVRELPDRRRVIGVTGSAGKSTTTAMIGHILERRKAEPPEAPPEAGRVWVGGNLGGSLLPVVGEIAAGDIVVLELSSFMLHYLRALQWSPAVAVVTNLSPNHLDWHGTLAEYRHAKQAILDFQGEEDWAVLGPDTDGFSPKAKGVVRIGADEHETEAVALRDLALPGAHNRVNARTAAAAVSAMTGCAPTEVLSALADFRGLPHRLQWVAQQRGVRFFNDSKSTTPESAIRAIESFPPGSVHVILGGYDKGSDLRTLAATAAARCRAIYTIGVTGESIAALTEQWVSCKDATGDRSENTPSQAQVVRCQTLAAAVRALSERVEDGEVALLSPGCASWDQFENYEQRGSAFVAAVQALHNQGDAPPEPRSQSVRIGESGEAGKSPNNLSRA